MLSFVFITVSSTVHAQNQLLVPPSPEPPVDSQNVETPPLPPVTVQTFKAELPETAVTQPQTGEATLEDGSWKIAITPKGGKRTNVDVKNYNKVYNSIPYRRSEYLANPSYRHDATMEVMFGQMRPTVVHKQDTPHRIVNPKPGGYNPGFFSELQYWNYPGRYLQYIPGFGPRVAPPLF